MCVVLSVYIYILYLCVCVCSWVNQSMHIYICYGPVSECQHPAVCAAVDTRIRQRQFGDHPEHSAEETGGYVTFTLTYKRNLTLVQLARIVYNIHISLLCDFQYMYCAMRWGGGGMGGGGVRISNTKTLCSIPQRGTV